MAIPTTADLRKAIGQAVQSSGKDIAGIRGWQLLDHESGKQICSFTSFFGFEYEQKAKVTDYPVEATIRPSRQGQTGFDAAGVFFTYNKQIEPFKATVTLIKDGINLPGDKEKFLQDLEKYLHGLATVDIITPSRTFINCIITGQSYKHASADGADLIMVPITIQEVRELKAISGESYFTAPISPDSATTAKKGLTTIEKTTRAIIKRGGG